MFANFHEPVITCVCRWKLYVFTGLVGLALVSGGVAGAEVVTAYGAGVTGVMSAAYEFPTTGSITATQIGDGVWWTPELDETSITQVLDDLSRWKVANLYVDVFRDGHTLFPSKVFPQRTGAGDRDWLRLIIERAHEKNIRVHGWMQVLRWSDDVADDDGVTHPLLMENPNWIDLPRAASKKPKVDSVFVNPGVPEVSNALIRMAREACTYRLDGISLDSIEYNPAADFGYNGQMTQEFRVGVGIDPASIDVDTHDDSPWMKWVAFREDKLTSLVDELHNVVVAEGEADVRRLLLSVAVGPGYEENRGKSRSYQHWGQWLNLKIIDATMPECFHPELPELEQQLWQARTLHMGSTVACVPGLALSVGPNGGHPSLREQRRLLRNVGFQHCTVLDYDSLRAAMDDTDNEPDEKHHGVWGFLMNRR